jgi:hypothetical protein
MSISEYNKISTHSSVEYVQVPNEFRVKPTDSDIGIGWYYRYFMSKSNGIDSVREVTKQTHDAFASNKFWIGYRLKWNIVGEHSYESNSIQIRMGLRIILGLDEILPNLMEFHTSGVYRSTGSLEPAIGAISEQSLFDNI